MILLARHALAVPRTAWDDDDAARPLTKRGERQADALVKVLKRRSIETVLTSPTERCTATVRPLAAKRDLKVKTSRRLREGRGDHALDLVLDAVGDVLLCTHGDVVQEVLRGLRHLGWPVPPRPRDAKGSVWLLSRASCDYLPPGA